jgi:ABC-type branched-subunit amino acid transport system ATPase component
MNDDFLNISKLEKKFDGVRALANFSCVLRRGEILGLIGPNGAGKSTLFNAISGFIPPDSGNIIFKGTDITGMAPYRIANLGIGRTFQNLRLIRQLSVLDNVQLSFKLQPGENLGNVFFKWRKSLAYESANRDETIKLLEDCGLAEKVTDPAEDLSYGQQKLLSLVCCLAARTEVLLLDEPVAGIAPQMIDRILRIISALPDKGKSVLLIEHNLDAVTQVCNRLIFMDAGANISEGTPEEVRNDPKVIKAYVE